MQEKLLEFVPNLPLCLPHRLLNRHGPGTHSLSSSVSQKSFLCSNFNPFYTLKCVQGARENELAALAVPCLAFLSLAITVDPQKRGEKLKQTLWSDYWLSCVRLLFPPLIFFLLLILILFIFPCLSPPAFPQLDSLSFVQGCAFRSLLFISSPDSCRPFLFQPHLFSPASILLHWMSFSSGTVYTHTQKKK